MTDAEVVRALVRSIEQLSYVQAQAEIDGDSPRETLALLAEVGPWREQRERDRGGVSLQIPEQEIVPDEPWPDGRPTWQLAYRGLLPVEGWNAQISLLTGMAAAHIMLYGQMGILRTMPPADHGSLRRLHQTAKALGIAWPAELDYPEFVRSLDPYKPDEAAMLNACTTLFRGAGYQAFSGGVPLGGRACGAGHRLRPRDRAAAPAGRPLRRGDLRRAVRRPARAELGAAHAGRVARGDGERPSGGPSSTSGRSSTWSRRSCSSRGWGRRSRAPLSRSNLIIAAAPW